MENKTYIDIETVTVGKLKAAIGATELLGQDIPTNDKTPIWDGHIFVYAKPGRRAEDLIRRVPVQVKGHVESSPDKEMVSHGIRVSDLNLFAGERGALFIKICVDEEGKNEA
ncbi:MAG: hypothetical protein J6P98_07245, partial [Clostridia bacterium]|nr:hypothetical protein [Clostridia bacterium]